MSSFAGRVLTAESYLLMLGYGAGFVIVFVLLSSYQQTLEKFVDFDWGLDHILGQFVSREGEVETCEREDQF